MAFTTETLIWGVAVALLVIFASTLLWRRQCKLYGNLPPGPRPLPILGSLHLMGTRPHRNLAELASQYGPLMTMWLGQRLCVVASTPETAKEFLKLQDANFAYRPSMRAGEIVLPGDIIFHDPTPVMRHLRKILVTELMTTRRLEASRYIRAEEMAFTLYKIANEDGPCCVNAHATIMATNVLSRMVFNKRFMGVEEQDGGAKMVEEFSELVKGMSLCFGSRFIGDFFNVPKWFDPQGLDKQFRKLRARLTKFYKKMINEYKEVQKMKLFKEGEKTFLDIFLEQLDSSENGVTEDHIEGIIYDLLAGGTETTATTIEWVMAEVLGNPTILAKVTAELDHVVGLNRTVQESDLLHLKYLHAVIKETLRFHPPIPFVVPHVNKDATKAFGYDIPAQTRVFVNLYAIGRNTNNWEKPSEFVPERFLEGGKNVATEFLGQHFELLPFGSGRRQCPGMNLASIAVHLQVASLLHAFKWDAEEVNLEEAKPTTTLPLHQPLIATAKKRLPLHLYQR